MEKEAQIEEEKQNKLLALNELEALFTSPFKNAIEYNDNNLPRFRESVKNILITLGELNLDLNIPKGDETEAMTMLAKIAKKHRDILGI